MSTMTSTDRRWSSSSNKSETFKFPDFEPSHSRERLSVHEEETAGTVSSRTSSPNAFPRANGTLHSQRWQPRRDSHVMWSSGHVNGSAGLKHSRQKSLSDAIKTIRTRKGSVGANAQEIAEALKAPVSIRLIVWTFISRPKCLSSIYNADIYTVDSLPDLVHEFCPYKHVL